MYFDFVYRSQLLLEHFVVPSELPQALLEDHRTREIPRDRGGAGQADSASNCAGAGVAAGLLGMLWDCHGTGRLC